MHRRISPAPLAALLTSALACGGSGEQPEGLWNPGSGDTDSTSVGTGGDGDGDGDGLPSFDVAEGDDRGGAEGGDQEGGCEKVDLLFVIDDSISMAGEQAHLIASFPEFISGIQTRLGNADGYHVGVVTTNAYEFNAAGCQQIGALVTQTGGASAAGEVCGPFATGRYLTDVDALASNFACIAQVGIDGPTDERPMQAMEVALGLAHQGPAGCNEGFLREDALLVIVVITDEEDDHFELYGQLEGSPGDPPDWYQAVVEAKGTETNAAVVSIIGGQPGNVCPEPSGVDGAEDAPRLRTFTELFTHGFVGDVCAASYGPIFNQAIDVVDAACEDFAPVP